jgi:hypothetical protein
MKPLLEIYKTYYGLYGGVSRAVEREHYGTVYLDEDTGEYVTGGRLGDHTCKTLVEVFKVLQGHGISIDEDIFI